MQNSWKAYFIFSKKEQRGIMVLGLLLLGSVLVGIVLPHKNSVEDNYSRYGNKNGDRNRYVDNNGNIKNNEDVSETNRSEPLFYFDPNTIDSSSALRLGIPLFSQAFMDDLPDEMKAIRINYQDLLKTLRY